MPGILVTVESVEHSEDVASSVLIMLYDEYVVSDSTSCVVMFVGGISQLNWNNKFNHAHVKHKPFSEKTIRNIVAY